MLREQAPHDRTEGQEADGTNRCAASFDGCCVAAAAGAVKAHTLFLFFLVSGYQCSGGVENCREGQKEAADRWPELFGDEAGGDGDQATEQDADGVLVPFGFFQRAEIYLNAHCHLPLIRHAGRVSNSPSEKSPPKAYRHGEPDDEEAGRGKFCLGPFAVHENHRAPGVDEEGGGSGEH